MELFQNEVHLRKLNMHVQKNEGALTLHHIQKIRSKWIKDPNLRVKTIKTPKRKDKGNLHDIGFVNDFLAITPKTEATKQGKLDSPQN